MTPTAFMAMEKLPLMSNGELDRRRCLRRISLAMPVRYEPPIGVTETALAQIWAEVLNLERVSRDDNFFETGRAFITGGQAD